MSRYHEPSTTPWVFWCIVCILFLFGAFWYYEQSKDVVYVAPLLPAAATSPIPPPSTSQAVPTPQPQSVDDLQEATLNTAIPNYSKDF